MPFRPPLPLGVSLVVPALAFSPMIDVERGSILEMVIEERYDFCSWFQSWRAAPSQKPLAASNGS